jgi:positive regulator of sigma E activity
MAAGHVTVAAVGGVQLFADVDGMHELLYLGAGGDVLLDLPDYLVAEVAVLGYYTPVFALMLAVMAAEAPRIIEVSDIVRIGIP